MMINDRAVLILKSSFRQCVSISSLFIIYAIDRQVLIELQFKCLCSFVIVVNAILEWNNGLGPCWMMSWDDLHRVDLGKLHNI